MIKLLSKIFIKNTDDAERLRRSYGMLCSAAGIALNVFLFAVKFFAGSISGAISVTADAFNNLSDSGSSVITMLGFRMAAKKPDPAHPFGHGRMEYLSGMGVSVLIILMGFELLISSVEKIFHPEKLEISPVVFIVLGLSIAVKLYMFAYNRKYGRLYNSAAMSATAADSLSDAVSTSAVMISMLVTYFSSLNIDAWCGAAVALLILYAGAKSVYETVQPLLGAPPEKEFVKKIEDIVHTSSSVIGMHDLIVHDYGPGRRMISLHAEVPADGDMLELHDEIDNIERELSAALGCSAIIHMDPVQNNDETVIRLKELTLGICHSINEAVTIHDFRVVSGSTHTNLIFDVVVPLDFKMSDSELTQAIDEKMKAVNSSYYAVITVDKDFTGA